MRNNIPEILAPAGSPQQLAAAVRAGADAVYMGASAMNARASAANFSDAEFIEAAAYCHECGVKVYLTMNTLLFDEEFGDAKKLLELACEAAVDGIIVQDVGLARCIARSAPDMPLHASTQMSIHTPAALGTISEMGFTRAVLAREMSARELSEMAASSPVELEVFVHGALCMSVSGQCLMSAMLGSRSGNRGRCAQPCRLPFRAGGFENCLSLRDNSLIPYIGELADMGIASLKIEGRMKRPEYCAAAVAACREARDNGAASPDIMRSIEAVFSRSGFTDGYYTAHRGKAMFGSRTKEDVMAADSAVMASLHSLYKNEFARVPVRMSLSAHAGECVSLYVCDDKGNEYTAIGDVPLIAENRPTDAADASARLAKTGGTPYIAREISCDIGDGLMLPASMLNGLRRDALGNLSQQRRQPRRIAMAWRDEDISTHERTCPQELHLIFSRLSQMPERLPEDVRRVYLPIESDRDALRGAVERLRASGIEPAAEAPRGIFGQEKKLREMLLFASSLGIKICMIHNIGLIEPVLGAGMTPYGGFGLNITNTRALAEYQRLGLCGTELSVEMTIKQISRLGGDMPRAVCVYGRQALMLTRNCPAALSGRCDKARYPGEDCSIIDRLGMEFPVSCRMGCSEVFNSIPLGIMDKIPEIGSVEHILMRFTVENSVETEEKLKFGLLHYPKSNTGFTRGLYYRGVE